jgi:hypothetical protein
LLTERGDRRTTGTRIEVRLKRKIDHGELTELVTDWCRRVEFPIHVDDLGKTSTIQAERPEDFVREEPDIINLGAKFVIRSFPVSGAGVKGELYIFAHIDEDGESWAYGEFAKKKYLTAHPQASISSLPENLICVHGIALRRHLWPVRYDSSYSIRIDVRRAGYPITLARQPVGDEARSVKDSLVPAEVTKCLQEVIREHIATTPLARSQDTWKYRQRLMDGFEVLRSFWRDLPDTVRIFFNRKVTHKSVAELQDRDSVTLVIPVGWSIYNDSAEAEIRTNRFLSRIRIADEVLITCSDLLRMSRQSRTSIFESRTISSVHYVSNNVLAFTYAKVAPGEPPSYVFRSSGGDLRLSSFPDSEVVGFELPYARDIVLNLKNLFVQWYLNVKSASEERRFGLSDDKFRTLSELFLDACKYPRNRGILRSLGVYLEAWRTIPGLPRELYPPAAYLRPWRFEMQPRHRRQRRGRFGYYPWKH